MKKNTCRIFPALLFICLIICGEIFSQQKKPDKTFAPSFKLVPSEKFYFNNFVDCNMAEAWIADTFRIFPGKYGEDTLWGNSRELKFASGMNPDQAFSSAASAFTEPGMPKNVPPGTDGLHGAVWFETIYQDPKDKNR